MSRDVRRAAATDGSLLAFIHRESMPPGDAWPADAFAAQLAMPNTSGFIDSAGAFVLARVMADEAELLAIAVMPECRRRGLARALLLRLIPSLASLGAKALYLEVSAHNTAARALYAGLEFQPIGIRRGYYADGADAIVLRRDLGRAAEPAL